MRAKPLVRLLCFESDIVIAMEQSYFWLNGNFCSSPVMRPFHDIFSMIMSSRILDDEQMFS